MATSFEDRAATDHRATDDTVQMEMFLTGALPCPAEPHKALTELCRSGATRRRRRITLPFPDLGDTQRSWLPQPAQNEEPWSADDIEDFHWNVLVSSARSLTDGRASTEMRERVIEWIARPLVPESQLPDYPLSFQATCAMCGWDPLLAQQRVLARFAPEKLLLGVPRNS